jgi:hypothetical protein
MPAIEAPHPFHLPAKLGHLINMSCQKVLVLNAGHPRVPFRTALVADCLQTFGASTACLLIKANVFGKINVRMMAVTRCLRSFLGEHAIQDNEDTTRDPWAIHHCRRRVQHHRLLIFHALPLWQHLCNCDIYDAARLHKRLATT